MKEKYISFTKNIKSTADNWKNSIKLRFINSYKFFNTSLDKLASFLNKDKLRILQREFSTLFAENFDAKRYISVRIHRGQAAGHVLTAARIVL